MRLFSRFMVLSLALLSLSGCSDVMFHTGLTSEATFAEKTRATRLLDQLPPPDKSIPIVVYDFSDQTGQLRNNGSYTEYSSAVTKGGYSILVNALIDAGQHQWFRVAERGGLNNLLQERQIIKVTRGQFLGPKKEQLPLLPPLLYGGMMIEGGIISYDSNIKTGGIGAMYLGIGGSVQYQQDIVGVYLRAVNVQTGEVLLSVNSSKTIFSASVDGNALRYITLDNLLQAEAGFTVTEPNQIGVRQAIESAVYSLVMEGAIKNLWHFRDPQEGKAAINAYLEKRDGHKPKPESPPPPSPPPQAIATENASEQGTNR